VGPHQEVTVQPTEFPEIRTAPEITPRGARFTQTTGGRTGLPAPRPVSGRPYVQWRAPIVWTTLTLFIGADGSAHMELTGASPFPQHWIYDHRGELAAKSGLISFRDLLLTSHGPHTPWGREDSQPLVTVAESTLERQLSGAIMHGSTRPAIRKLRSGALLSEQGEPGEGIYLLLDGVLSVRVDGTEIAELGPGAVVGERVLLEHGRRTATLLAITDCVVAAADHEQIDRDSLAILAGQHDREESHARV
jgi:Cyclic nucleotide-binding domain